MGFDQIKTMAYYKIPKSKKNLHECLYHIKNMEKAENAEELETNFAAFVNSARSVTFVLQKEFRDDPKFISWYGDSKKYKDGNWESGKIESKSTKIYEMKNDELCKYFIDTRNKIVKEGINGLEFSCSIGEFNSDKDVIDRPVDSSLAITDRGIFYLINEGTPQQDIIPAKTKGEMVVKIKTINPPLRHMKKTIPIEKTDIISLSIMYYNYLKSLVEEWTETLNN